MRLFTILFTSILVTGCATLLPKNVAIGTTEDYSKIPLVELFDEIVKEPYKIHVYDCSNKSAKYIRALREAGYEADMICVKPYVSPLGLLHAIVRIKLKDGSILYVDPTNNEWSRKIKYFGTFMWLIEGDLDKNYEAFGDRLHEIQ
jgi:hypothetical protein